MKRVALSTGMLILVAIGSAWFGYESRGPALITGGYSVMVTDGGGDYPKEAFRIINDELPAKLDSLLGEFSSQHYIVAVLPEISGYRVRMGGPPGKLWDKEIERKLREWISRRMDAIVGNQRMAEQAAPSDGDKPSN